ncbi:hypothetical protein H5410_003443 [Solanum commersonii]|uniref:Uncharacterized protein n=1 Tax=Solanum commersonii TaxID=4109 RepID=A0A9J6B4P5_SOLCO|nr:hypothetical protein H5410_003443 [Solanum commersonii]
MHNFTHRFAHIFQSTFVSAHSRSKRKVIVFIKFLPKKAKAQGVFKRGSHTITRYPTKKVYIKLAHTLRSCPKIISRDSLT